MVETELKVQVENIVDMKGSALNQLFIDSRNAKCWRTRLKALKLLAQVDSPKAKSRIVEMIRDQAIDVSNTAFNYAKLMKLTYKGKPIVKYRLGKLSKHERMKKLNSKLISVLNYFINRETKVSIGYFVQQFKEQYPVEFDLIDGRQQHDHRTVKWLKKRLNSLPDCPQKHSEYTSSIFESI